MTKPNQAASLKHRFVFAVTFCAALLTALVFTLPTQPQPSVQTSPTGPVALVNARVFDGKQVLVGATILIDDGQIAAVGSDVALDANVTRIDATGQTVLPGLIDAHTHSYGDALSDSVRFGVTTTLDMFTAPALLASAKTERASFDTRRTADLYSAGMLATVDGGHGTQFGIEIDTLSGPQDAQGFVARRLAEGSDYIKLVYIPYQDAIPSLDLATCKALIAAAHAAGVLAVAHISQAVAAQELLDAGIDGLVHVFDDEPVSAAFVAQAAAARLFVIPTLSVLASANALGEGALLAADPSIAPYLSDAQRAGLSVDMVSSAPRMTMDLALANVRRLHDGGVTILAGTDAPNAGTTHGASAHQELALLNRAGLSPLQALIAATSAPAERFALQGRGQIRVGARADLVLVNGNPLQDISATRAIARVYRNGQLVERHPDGADAADMPRGLLATFTKGLDAPTGFTWNATDDQSFGGRSSARLEHLAATDVLRNGAVRAVTQVSSGFAYPWAGAFFSSSDNEPRAVGDNAVLSLRLRGTPGAYRVMFFNAGSAGAPPTTNVTLNEQWQDISIALDDVVGLNKRGLAGLAIVAGPAPGDYQFDIADVALTW